MRWLGILVRLVGWLLTPLVAWAASFSAAWVALLASDRFENPRTAIIVALVGALAAGIVALRLWMRLLRRSPRLRHSLHVDREGLPVIDDLVPEAPAEPVSTPPAGDEGP